MFSLSHVLVALGVLSLLLEVGQALVDPGPPGRLVLLGLAARRPEVALARVRGTPSTDVSTGGVVTSTVTGLVTQVVNHEELVATCIVWIAGDACTTVVSGLDIAVYAVVCPVANLPSLLDAAVATLYGVLFVDEELVVFWGQVHELEVSAVAVSHLLLEGGLWLGGGDEFNFF